MVSERGTVNRYYYYLIYPLLLLCFACTEFIASVDLDSDWEIKQLQHIVLHYRPENHTRQTSPNMGQVHAILSNQNRYYQEIKDTLNLVFRGTVLIYLYNKDEAQQKIGTTGGGHTVTEFQTIYYTWFGFYIQDTDSTPTYMGRHELVHILTHQALGKPGTQLMSEGYAVALDGGYGVFQRSDSSLARKTLAMWLDAYWQTDDWLTPEALLEQTNRPEEVYYPQAGWLIKFLFNEYGVALINQLFTISPKQFKKEFERVTGDSFADMSGTYQQYCHTKFSNILRKAIP